MNQTFERKTMKNYMNKPVDKSWTNEDVKADYKLYKDIKLVARRYQITVSEVRKIVKEV